MALCDVWKLFFFEGGDRHDTSIVDGGQEGVKC